ncbi:MULTISPECIES: hypothetical protein [Sorangium]|uniref:hypothetical protein n=1 Tax=Sorangium TaxID=39643 RepID=UPI003D9C1A0D
MTPRRPPHPATAGTAKPPHPATAQRAEGPGAMPPHPATVQRRAAGAQAPHPATVQRAEGPGAKPPHPATVQRRAAGAQAPHPAKSAPTAAPHAARGAPTGAHASRGPGVAEARGRVGQPAMLVDSFVVQPPTFEPLDSGPSRGFSSRVSGRLKDRREGFKTTTKPGESRKKRSEQLSERRRMKREELVRLSRSRQLERTDGEDDPYELPVEASYSIGQDGLFEGRGVRRDGTAVLIQGSSIAGIRYEMVEATGPRRWKRVPYSGPEGGQ